MVEGKVDQEAVDLLAHYRDQLAMRKMETEGGDLQETGDQLDWQGGLERGHPQDLPLRLHHPLLQKRCQADRSRHEEGADDICQLKAGS